MHSPMHSPKQLVSFGWAALIAWRGVPELGRRLWSVAGGLRLSIDLRRVALCTLLAAFALPGGTCFAQEPCPRAGNASGRVVSVDERLDLTLEDGTRLKIGGIDPARPTPTNPEFDETAREILGKWLIGQAVEFRPLEPHRDRWGRVIAMVFAPVPEISKLQSQARLPVGEAIIDAGLARYEPNTADGPCRALLLAAEAEARASGLGLWADQYYAVIAARDRDSLAEKAGSPIIVEGQVTRMNVRKPRITLYFGPRKGDFGPRKGADFSVTIRPSGSKAFAAAQTRLAGVEGQNIRVRGLLDTRFGPQIEISDLDALELISQGQTASGTPK
jgi:endonuclease YncB( thermonuclease family)